MNLRRHKTSRVFFSAEPNPTYSKETRVAMKEFLLEMQHKQIACNTHSGFTPMGSSKVNKKDLFRLFQNVWKSLKKSHQFQIDAKKSLEIKNRNNFSARFFEYTLIWGHAYMSASLFECRLIWAHANQSARLFVNKRSSLRSQCCKWDFSLQFSITCDAF